MGEEMVFISYSSKDYAVATKIRNRLCQNNVDCWMAPDSIPGGSDYAREIPAAIESCDYFLIILSENSQKSVWVPKELDLAITAKKTVLPIIIDSSVLEASFRLRLSNVQCLDASVRLDEILQIISYRINGKDSVPNASDVTSDLPEILTFYELLGIENSKEIDIDLLRSATDITKSMAVPVGKNDQGEIVYLDLHHKGDGSNNIICGPVGSGKSEFIETALLSLALHFSEDDVIFDIVDLKGGGIAHELAGLPHIHQSLVEDSEESVNAFVNSIKTEVDRRDKLLQENNVDNIYQYLKLRKEKTGGYEPMPHLILAVDEIAILKMQYPEAARELIRLVDQVGSAHYGIHLIMGTQYVFGVVDDVLYRLITSSICSSMQRDLMGDPIKGATTIPGRMYFQSEAQDYVQLIQLAYCGMTSDPNLSSKVELKDFDWFCRKEQKKSLISVLRRYNLD